MRIAIVHDDLIQLGGAEKLLSVIHSIWPNTPIFTAMFDKSIKEGTQFSKIDIRTSWMQKLPLKKILRRFYFPLYPLAFESFAFDDYDLVISSSTRFAHSIITKPKTYHICYLNTPPRFLWDQKNYLKNEPLIFPLSILVMLVNSYLRIWDTTAATRVDAFIANSKNIKSKIAKFYRQDAKVVYPFVDLNRFKPKARPQGGKYYLIVTRLLAWKQVDIAITAANQLKLPLKIIGMGPDFFRLKKLAGPTVDLVGKVSDQELIGFYQDCKAFIITQNEDFGIAAVEAQACGKPVIAYEEGGALETIIAGKTGLFFSPQGSKALIDVLEQFEKTKFDFKECVNNAKRFSKEIFVENFKATIEKLWQTQPII